jgi:sugar lactone lactonase YvrE
LARADYVYVSELYDPGVNAPAIYRFDSVTGIGGVWADTGLSGPNGLAFDSSGSLYVANYGNNTIEAFDSSGTGSLFTGSGLSQPHVLAFDNSHNLYVANDNNGQGYIEKYDSTGQGSVFATGLYQPQGITCDNNGNVYVSTWINNQTALAILKYTPGGQRSTFVTWNAPGTHFGIPRGLAFYNNNLYCTDGSSLDKITLGGQVSVLTTAGMTNSIGVAVDSGGNFYVTDQNMRYVMQYSPLLKGSIFASGFNAVTYVAVQPVPEPATVSLFALGMVVVGWRRRRFAWGTRGPARPEG